MSDVSSTTGLTGAGGGDKIRITGMATGLDVDALVKKMMKAEQAKMDKLKQARQKIAWKQEGYQDIIKDMKDLQSNFFDSTSEDKNILSTTGFTPYNVTIGDEAVASISALSGAKAGKYNVNVTKLAAGAGSSNQLASNITLSSKLTDVDSSITNGIMSFIVNTGGNNINIQIDNTSGNATVSDLVNAINNGSAGTVKASFSEVTKKLTINSTGVGPASKLTVQTATDDKLSAMFGITEGNEYSGTQSEFTITEPGESNPSAVIKQDTNNFTLDGISYNLTAAGATDFSVSQDTDKVYNKIKDFVTKYNTVVDKIQSKIIEKRNYDYAPLTDDQKAAMKDSDIAAWNDKAKQGVLRSDDNLENLLNDLKSAFHTAVKNSGLTLGKYGDNAIGVDFSTDYNKPCHIEILDDSKLKDAIQKHSTQIVTMFTNQSTKSLSGTYDATKPVFQEDGILTRIKKIFENNVGLTNVNTTSSVLTKYANLQDDFSLTGTGGTNTIPDQLYEQDILIKNMTKTLKDKQEKYYKNFSKLETAMQQLNSQQQSLTSMLGG